MLYPAYLTYMHITSCEMSDWINGKLQSRLSEEISTTSVCTYTTLMSRSEEELKSLLKRAKEESEKASLKLKIQKIKIMASSPITSWQTDGGRSGNWQILFSWAPKSLQTMTAANELKDAYSLERRRQWHPTPVLLSRKSHGRRSLVGCSPWGH